MAHIISTHWARRGVLFLLIGILIISLSISPSYSDDSRHAIKIESDDAQVVREGEWINQPAPSASGGSYLYNSGEAALLLQFAGPSLEVIYVAGPLLGTLAIEVDGVVLRTVITTDAEVRYQQSAKIDYLTDEAHTLKVYAQAGGVIGVDAFIVAQPAPPIGLPSGQIVEAVVSPRPQPTCNVPTWVRLITTAYDGGPSNGLAWSHDISADGHWVAFNDSATNLLPSNGTPARAGYYRLNVLTCEIEMIGYYLGDVRNAPAISDDGRFIKFVSDASLDVADTNSVWDTYLRDMQTGQLILISQGAHGVGNATSVGYDMSGDGRFILIQSYASNLVPSDTNEGPDFFVFDRLTNIMQRVSVQTGGGQMNYTPNVSNFGNYGDSAISDDGSYIVFVVPDSDIVPNDNNGCLDGFLVDRQSLITTRLTITYDGNTPTCVPNLWGTVAPAISGNGRFVSFTSVFDNLVPGDTDEGSDVFLYERETGQTTLLSPGYGGSTATDYGYGSTFSNDGRYVVLSGNGLLPDTDDPVGDIYLLDRQTNILSMVSLNSDGNPYVHAGGGKISDDGRFVTFTSPAAHIIEPDTNQQNDLFLIDYSLPHPMVYLEAVATDVNQIRLTQYRLTSAPVAAQLERSPNGQNNWQVITTLAPNQETYANTGLDCGATYYYRLHLVAPPPMYATYSNVTSFRAWGCQPDTVALFRSEYNWVSLISTIALHPTSNFYYSYGANPPDVGQYVMGDWDGDGNDTPGVYANSGVFYFTNAIVPNTTWEAIWVGLFNRPVVAGRFDATYSNDCIGVPDVPVTWQTYYPYPYPFPWPITFGGTALYWTCDFSHGPAPALRVFWMTYEGLPTNSGEYQFTTGDYEGDGLDSLLVRKGNGFRWASHPPTIQQFTQPYWININIPLPPNDYGIIVAGDWNGDGVDTFGLVCQNGLVYYRNVNFLSYELGSDNLPDPNEILLEQQFGLPFGTPYTATTWHP